MTEWELGIIREAATGLEPSEDGQPFLTTHAQLADIISAAYSRGMDAVFYDER